MHSKKMVNHEPLMSDSWLNFAFLGIRPKELTKRIGLLMI
jgi:hypothetical protein